jgi:lysozyme
MPNVSLTPLLALPFLFVAGCSAAPTDGASSTAADELRVCAAGPTVEGVDVSYYEPNIDFAALKKGGIDFAFIRVSDGATFIDPEFSKSWAAAKQAGVLRGAYQFFRPAQDPIKQADALLNEMGPLDADDLSPVLDVEVTGGVGASTIVARIGQWVAHVKAQTGRTPIIYTSPGFWSGLGTHAEGADTLWVANWGVSCPSVPSSWKTWTFWQYTDSGHVAGIANKVDRNRFNGTLVDLKAFAGK